MEYQVPSSGNGKHRTNAQKMIINLMDHTFKIVLIGGASVGKSAIFRRYMEAGFSEKSQATISANYLEKAVKVPGSSETLRI